MAGCGQVAEGPEGETAALSTHVLYCTGKNLIIVKQKVVTESTLPE